MSASWGSHPINYAKYCDPQGNVTTIARGDQNDITIFKSNYLRISIPSGDASVYLKRVGNPSDITLYISKDDGRTWSEWYELDYQSGRGQHISTTEPQNFPGHFLISGHGSTFSTNASNYYQFSSTGDNVTVSGDLQSLLDFSPTAPQHCFANLFRDWTKMIGTTPKCSATNLGIECFRGLYYGCTGITTASPLIASTIANGSYYQMFFGCTGLTSAPALKPTTMTANCYYQTFYGCSSLANAPALVAKTPMIGCYRQIFYGCSSMNNISISLDSAVPSQYMQGWMAGVAETGTLHCTTGLKTQIDTMGRAAFSIPDAWTITTDVD